MYDKLLLLCISSNSSRKLCLVTINRRHKGAALAQSQDDFSSMSGFGPGSL